MLRIIIIIARNLKDTVVSKSPRWPEEDDADLVKAVLRGESISSIAEYLGRTENAIYCRLRFLRVNGVALPRVREVHSISRQQRIERIRSLASAAMNAIDPSGLSQKACGRTLQGIDIQSCRCFRDFGPHALHS